MGRHIDRGLNRHILVGRIHVHSIDVPGKDIEAFCWCAGMDRSWKPYVWFLLDLESA